MGVSSTTNTLIFAGDGVSASFSFPYYFFAQTDMGVFVYDTVAGGIVQKAPNVDFTISGTPNAQGLYPSGGSIVFGTAPVATVFIMIIRIPPRTSVYALGQNGQISSVALVQQMDYLTLLVQRLADQVSRCVQFPDGFAATFNPALPSTAALIANANAYLQVNSNANGFSLQPTAPTVQSVVVPYTALQTAGLTTHYPLFTLPAGAILTNLIIKHSTVFAGTSISALNAELGISTNYTKFLPAFNLLTAVGDQVFDNEFLNYIASFANDTLIYLSAVAVGANLSALSQGSVTVWYGWQYL